MHCCIPLILVAKFGNLQEGIDTKALKAVYLEAASPVFWRRRLGYRVQDLPWQGIPT
jgi:hypothetical protein